MCLAQVTVVVILVVVRRNTTAMVEEAALAAAEEADNEWGKRMAVLLSFLQIFHIPKKNIQTQQDPSPHFTYVGNQ
jgi:hypothetical protein